MHSVDVQVLGGFGAKLALISSQPALSGFSRVQTSYQIPTCRWRLQVAALGAEKQALTTHVGIAENLT